MSTIHPGTDLKFVSLEAKDVTVCKWLVVKPFCLLTDDELWHHAREFDE